MLGQQSHDEKRRVRRLAGWGASLIIILALAPLDDRASIHAHALALYPASQPVRTIDVGGPPYQVAVDSQTGRAFVMVGPDSAHPGGSPLGQVVILDTRTDAILRRITVGEIPGSLALDAHTNRVFVGTGQYDTGGQRELMLDARTGVVLRVLTGGSDFIIDEQRNRVFSGSDVFDARSGNLLGTYEYLGPGGPAGGAALAERAGRYYSAGGNDQVGIIDTAGPIGPRTFVGTITVHNGMTAMAVDEQTNRLFISIGCCWPYGISVLDARTGNAIGTLPVGGSANALVVDAYTHRLFVTWSDHAGNGPAGVYVIHLDGLLGAHALWSQRVIGTSSGPIVVDERTGLVILADAAHMIWILDGKTGAVLRSAVVSSNPASIAIDDPTNQVFVASYNKNGVISVLGLTGPQEELAKPVGPSATPTVSSAPTCTPAAIPTVSPTPIISPTSSISTDSTVTPTISPGTS